MGDLEKKGRDLFFSEAVGCSDCHKNGIGTDGEQWAIWGSSKDPLDTPSLKNIRRTAPYLHDGSAATLEDVLDLTAGKMGNTKDLSAADRKALIAYMLTL